MSYPPRGKRLKSNIESEFRKIFQKEGFEEIETPVLFPKQLGSERTLTEI